jgi:DnaJ-class molecular chaperone
MLHVKLVCRSVSVPSYSHHCYSTLSSNSVNPYKILGVERNVTEKQIKSAYYELSKKYHPDTGATGALAAVCARMRTPCTDADTDKFLAITEAYAILSDEHKRKLYDREVARTLREYTDEHWQPRAARERANTPSNIQNASYFGKAYPGT